jgi:hypothetical protein
VPEAGSVAVEPTPPRNGTSYSIGNFVVHPKYGVGRVEGIQDQFTGGALSPCLEIVFPQQEMKLSIVDQVERSGMRRPIARRGRPGVRVLRSCHGGAEPRSVSESRPQAAFPGGPHVPGGSGRDLGRLSRRKPLYENGAFSAPRPHPEPEVALAEA